MQLLKAITRTSEQVKAVVDEVPQTAADRKRSYFLADHYMVVGLLLDTQDGMMRAYDSILYSRS